MKQSSKTIVILGGGVGGICVANQLRKRIPHSHRIVVVEKNTEHAFAPSFLWLATGSRTPQTITEPLKNLLRPGIEIVNATILGVDLSKRQITTSRQTLTYDYLIVALGAELVPENIPGLAESAYSFYTLEETKKLRTRLSDFSKGKIVIVVCSTPYQCPGAPHEASMLIADYFQKRGIRDNLQIHLATPEPQPMPVAGPQLGDAVKQMLASKGIGFHPLHKLTSVNPKTHQLSFEGKEPTDYDLLIAIPPHRAPAVIRGTGLLNEAGWIPVDCFTLRTSVENVYAIGDITTIPIPGRWKPDVPMMLPKAGVFAHAQAEIVARRIADKLRGFTPEAKFDGLGFCVLETGGGCAAFAYGNFFGEPSPKIKFRPIKRIWHLGKMMFEQWWLSEFGLKKTLLQTSLKLGSRILGVPSSV